MEPRKGTYSGIVFHVLSHSVVLLLTVSFWNHQLEASHWLIEEFWSIRKWFLELILAAKRTTPHARAQNNMLGNGAFSLVPFCLRSQVHLEKCVKL